MPVTFTTPDGLTILIEELPHTHSVSVGCFVGVGALYEPFELSGISHAIEHMCFKGTRSLPGARQISEAVEGVGGILNASTSYESTIYWCKVADYHFDRALHVLTELARYPLFDGRELEKERRVIIEEIRGTQDSPSDWVHDLLQESLWGEQALGRDIAGSVESVSGLTRDDLMSFWRAHYGIDRMVISVAGNIRSEPTVAAISAAFAGLPVVGQRRHLPILPPQPGPRLQLLSRDTEQGNFCLGMPGLSYNDPDRRALQVLDTIVGGGMSSRLFQELREERGVAYSIGSYHSEFDDAGAWVIYGSVETDTLRDSIEVTLDILREVLCDGVTEEELTLVKEQVKGGILLSLEDTWAVASRNGMLHLRYGAVMPVERVVAEIEAVTTDAVRRVARRILRSEGMHLTVIGPYDEENEAELRAMIEAGLG